MEESLQYLQFMENAEEEEAWLSEKDATVSRGDSGDTLAATQVKEKQNGSIVSSLSFEPSLKNVVFSPVKLEPISWVREMWMLLLILV